VPGQHLGDLPLTMATAAHLGPLPASLLGLRMP
jgi:hypothetical protein